jgi:hypothetical protein
MQNAAEGTIKETTYRPRPGTDKPLEKTSDFSPVARVELKADADNLRVDPIKNLVFAGFGSGGLAIIDAKSHKKVGEIDLKGHPEGFELEPSGERAFVNVPDARGIAVLDRTSSRQIATWTVPQATWNFPMAIRQRGTELLIGFRRPARLAIVDTRGGNLRANTPTCGDPDDISVDEKRNRAYVSCGQVSLTFSNLVMPAPYVSLASSQ